MRFFIIPYCPEKVLIPLQAAHPPILTVLWFFKVLRVTAHHAKCVVNPKVCRFAHTRLWPHLQHSSPVGLERLQQLID